MTVDPTPTPRKKRVRELFRHYGVTIPEVATGERLEILPSGQSSAVSAKELGAYYTNPEVAAFLVRWAIRSPDDVVLDPSSGDGAFLAAATQRVVQLGGDPAAQVHGVEIDEIAYRRSMARASGGAGSLRFRHGDFFDFGLGDLPLADAVIGNPPFIRYQRFSGEARARALSRAREAGVRIPELASAWAPFLVHAVNFVRPSGRLAMVVPAEIAHASYARPVLRYLLDSFRSLHVLSFARKLFPRLSEDTMLLLAEGRGETFEELRLVDLADASSLGGGRRHLDVSMGTTVDAEAVAQGRERLLHYLLPGRTRDLYRQLRSSLPVPALGDLATASIGYVSGDNDFFHLNASAAASYGLPPEVLTPAVRDGSDLPGIRLTRQDWDLLKDRGRAIYLLDIQPGQELTPPIRAYLAQGVQSGVPNRYKCRVRDPWYSVPHVYRGDAFLTYMSGAGPRLVANEVSAVSPNTLHVVRLLPECPVDAVGLAACWQTSLTALSCELEGHSLGGGMLKLEPGEAKRVAVALPSPDDVDLRHLSGDMEVLLRRGEMQEARDLGDRIVLREGLGLSTSDIDSLRAGHQLLRNRRQHR